MSRINYALSIFLLSSIFYGCAPKTEIINNSTTEVNASIDTANEKNRTAPLVADEAAFFMAAVDAIDGKEYEKAAAYLNVLYKQTGKKQYLMELVKIYSAAGEFEAAKTLLISAIAKNDDDLDTKKMLAANYIGQKEYAKALEVAEAIAARSKQKEDYDTAGSIAYVVNDYKTAQKYFKLSYTLKPDHITADRIASILFLEKKGGEATAFLDTHIRMFGCSKYLCERLAGAYIDRNDQRGALEVYKKLYFKIKDARYIKKIIELSVAGSDVNGLIAFLKKSKKDDVLLFEAYKYKKDNKNAAILAAKLYAKTKDLNYLAQSVIYKFESYPEKKPHWLVKESVKNLEIVTNGMQNDVYDNYLGYLLIDYDIDTARGVELVKRALGKDPTSIYYKDSLAWGYYKQKKCAEANEIMKAIAVELKDDKTVIEHFEAIKKCLGGQK